LSDPYYSRVLLFWQIEFIGNLKALNLQTSKHESLTCNLQPATFMLK